MEIAKRIKQIRLEKGLSQASKILNSPKADEIINQIKKNQSN